MLPWIPFFLGLGWLLKRSSRLPPSLPALLGGWALNVALPATVIRVLAGMPLSRIIEPPVLLPWLLLAVLSLLVPIILRSFGHFSPDQKLLLCLLIPLGNTSFLGLPLLQAVRGVEALPPALLYDQFGSFPQLLLLGTLLLERTHGDRAHWLMTLMKKILGFPPFFALLLALSPLGPVLRDLGGMPLKWLALTLVPAVMLALGTRLRLSLPAGERPAFWVGLGGKMLLAPLLAALIVWIAGWRGADVQVALLESAMPPMATAAAWAGDRGVCPELAASLVSGGILIALVWIPLLNWLLQHGPIG